ncbi:hypothetical protein GDO86_003418 [Hymenochirus boettgeri]|uniref:Uncharacterized protein n=1 Tax=Hymenochirus boettgeri TaxID=247094 RepID=A0A8T2K0T9_9PIPI|nr:hypothetical protein GDO86_003418 [Hymenochirus boettgeri]
MPDIPSVYKPLAVESPHVPDFWLYRCLRRLGGFLAHVLTLGFTIFLVILLDQEPVSLFSWHPVFMAIAVMFVSSVSYYS